jgi:hypothetical protein
MHLSSKFIIIFIFFLKIYTTQYTQAQLTFIKQNSQCFAGTIISKYSGEGNFNDDTGANNMVLGAGSVSFATGIKGSCFYVPSPTTYITIKNGSLPNGSSFAISYWIYQYGSQPSVISHYCQNNPSGYANNHLHHYTNPYQNIFINGVYFGSPWPEPSPSSWVFFFLNLAKCHFEL